MKDKSLLVFSQRKQVVRCATKEKSHLDICLTNQWMESL